MMLLNEIVRQYSKLQASLVRAFLETVQPTDLEFFHDIARSGRIYHDGEEWSWSRHGAGVAFRSERSGVTVDAHVGMAKAPEGVDAWRLVTFLESTGVRQVQHGEMNISAEDERGLSRLLEAMVDEKELQVKTGGHPRLLVPAPKSLSQ